MSYIDVKLDEYSKLESYRDLLRLTIEEAGKTRCVEGIGILGG